MTIRLLTPAELPFARALVKAEGAGQTLHPNANVLGALTDEGVLVGALGVETVYMVGPLVMARHYRGKLIPAQLAEKAEGAMRSGERVCGYTASGHVMRLFEDFGMREMPGHFFMKEVL
jgi:hypothetical protein